MSMTYSQLTANIQDICETTFTSDELAMFVQQAEQFIYNTVQLPSLRKNVSGTITSGNKYLTVPSDYLYTYSLAVVNADGSFDFLLNKDVSATYTIGRYIFHIGETNTGKTTSYPSIV